MLLCEQLLEVHRNGVDLTSVDRNGLTALHHAAALGNKRIVKYLIEKGKFCVCLTAAGSMVATLQRGMIMRLIFASNNQNYI